MRGIRGHILRARILPLLAIGGLALVLASACSGAEETAATPEAEVTAATTAAPSQSSTVAPPPVTATPGPDGTVAGIEIEVFFSRQPGSNDDPSLVFPVSRVSPDAGVARFAIAELLAGPTPAEAAAGYSSAWTQFMYGDDSSCGGDLYTVAIEDRVATVQFCVRVLLSGVVADAAAFSALNATLEQFSTVDRVVILNSRGGCMFDLSGLDLCLEEG